jgi:hypothetical protein
MRFETGEHNGPSLGPGPAIGRELAHALGVH